MLTAADRRHVDNRSASLPSHLGDGISTHEHHARDVDAEVSIPGRHVNGRDIAQRASDTHYEEEEEKERLADPLVNFLFLFLSF